MENFIAQLSTVFTCTMIKFIILYAQLHASEIIRTEIKKLISNEAFKRWILKWNFSIDEQAEFIA